ncbi:MATE family efflux transporter [Allocoprobacillus halotolerans]|uniref:Probable multidrug resistance protein NorM n=1 Tax=Allocoprobacillus halotolerans TaxID=2944914 RepID=A0ABY5I1N9_9FIRM|nr:MATE family efflux transporter [Allocoprobacillus halotolerans]UTY38677.1 MATE family efflux transporter [Allocoprobacillus halotolerans]
MEGEFIYEKRNPMGYKPILPLLMSMAFPPMISMLIQSLYNIIDSIFVAQLGEAPLTAVSLIYPLQNLSLAFSCGVGIAMNAIIARHLGAHNDKEASFVASQGIVMTLLHSLLFIVLGLFFIQPFLSLFTQNADVMRYGQEYGMIVITFTFSTFIHLAIEKMFQACGNMIIPMIMQMVGAIVNIILDPILIFGYFGLPALGVSGAALATIIGQFSACFLSIYLFSRYNSHIHISFRHFRFHWTTFKHLYSIAIPSGVMMCLPSILVSVLNGILASVSQTAVAFFGVYYKLQTFVNMPTTGVIQGMRPIMSYNYGAHQKERMNQTLKMATLTIGTILLLGTCLFFIFPAPILQLFNANQDMLSIGTSGLRILSLSFIFSTFAIVMSGVFESLGKGSVSLIITLTRQFIIIIPLSFMLLPSMGLTGIWLTFPLSELIATIIAFILYQKVYKNIKIGNEVN